MADKVKRTGGGAATNAGIDYQGSVAAWYMCKLLAESGTALPYNLPSNDKFTQIDFETDEPTDDINIKTHLGSNIYVQAKRTLSLSASEDSELAKSIGQFVKQYLKTRDESGYDAGKERYVLAYSRTSPQTVDKAADTLDKIRSGTPMDRLPTAEKSALNIVKEHIKRLLASETGDDPSDDAIREMLSSLYFHKLNVLDNDRDALVAQDILRNLLADTSQATLAWGTLRSDAVSFGRQRGSARQDDLVAQLSNKGVRLNSSVDYTPDIAKLKDYTQTVTLPILERSSSIDIDGTTIKLERKPVQVMRDLTNEGRSFLVVGEPGAGKSGSLYELIKLLQGENKDVLAIAAEQISSSSFGDIQRELNLENPLNNVLMNWRGAERGVVVIDALDAARNPEALKLFMDIARQIIRVSDRWSVVISIRKYDLRHNDVLKDMFPKEQLSEFIDPEFTTAHINIPLLSDEEREQLTGQSSKLGTLIQKAGSRMRDLLRSPFNVKIAAEIMESGIDADELTEIDTQIGLLDRYWDVRVSDGGGDGTARNVLVNSIANNMVQSQSLKVAKLEVAKQNPTSNSQLEDLLSRGVLSEESQGDFLSFSHHIIYDYAIYRTILRAGPNGIKDLLSGNPYLALSVRPSIQMYWQYEWHSDPTRQAFWSEVIRIEQDESISRLAKSLGIQIAVESIKEPEDTSSLIDLIKDADQTKADAALSVYKRCSDTMAAAKKRDEPDNAEKWVPALNEILNLKDDYPTRVASCTILESAIEKWSEVPQESKILAGSAARKLLEVELEKDPPHKWVMRKAIKLVADTFETNRDESRRVLSGLLQDKLILDYGYMYLGDLADCVGNLANQDDELVYRIYETAFTHDEKSSEVTPMLNSQIMGLNSNRKQDYDMVYWHLGQKYKEVARADLPLALRALDLVLVETANRYGTDEEAEVETKTFPYYGSEQSLERSRAYSWHPELHTGDKGHETYEAFNQYADELSANNEGHEILKEAIKKNAGVTNSPQFWCLILSVGAKHPQTIGSALIPLLTAEPLLKSPETSGKLGEFIIAMYPTLDQKTREEVEQLLTTAPDQIDDEYDQRRALAIRDMVFAEVDEGQLVTNEAIELRTAQAQNKDEGEDVPSRIGRYADEDFWERGKSEEDKTLLRLTRSQETPINSLQPVSISTEKIAELFKLIAELEAALQENAAASDDSKREVNRLIARIYEKICRSPNFTPSSDNWEMVTKKVLSTIVELPAGTVDTEAIDEDEEQNMLSDYGARSVSVETLMVLANKETDANRLNKLHDMIRSLVSDQSPTARFMIASNAHYLWRKDSSDFAWEIINKIKDNETNSGIVHHLASSLSRLRGHDPDQTYPALLEIYKKWQGSKNENLREIVLQLVVEAFVVRNDEDAKALLDEVLTQPIQRYPELDRVEVHLRDYLTRGIEDQDDTESAEIRARARDVMLNILGSYDEEEEYQKWSKKHEGKKQSDLTKEEIQEVRSILGHTDNIAKQVYFASGSYDEKTKKEGGPTEDAKKVFLQENKELIDLITATGRVAAAYDFVGMALTYQETDPVWALKLVEQLVINSAQKGATSESLMAGSVATFVKTFIASHREYLREPANQQALINILDGFVETGWPEAINLMGDLEEIFR